MSRARACPPGALASIAPARILVAVSDERMGEILLAGPLVRALSATFPFARIDLLLAQRYAWLAPMMPGIREALPFKKRDFFRRPLAFLAFIRSLRAARYGLAVDGGKDDPFSFTTALLMRTSGATIRLGHKREITAFLTLAVERGAENLPDAARRLSLMKAFGDKSFEASLRLTSERDGRQALISTLQEARFKVGIYAGARKPENRVAPEVLTDVASLLARDGAGVLIIPGVGEVDLCKKVAERGGALLAPVAAGADLCALLQTCDLVVANDTGPMHLSVALGVPTLGLFVKDEVSRWGHSEPPNRTLFLGTPADGDPGGETPAGRIARTAMDMLKNPGI